MNVDIARIRKPVRGSDESDEFDRNGCCGEHRATFGGETVLNDRLLVVSVVRDASMYKRCVEDNPFLAQCRILPLYNIEKNDGVPTCYNRAIKKLLPEASGWIVFCHEDFMFLEDPAPLLNSADRQSVWGVFGGVTTVRRHWLFGEVWGGTYEGQLIDSDKNGARVREIGHATPIGTRVDTLDCCCLIVHSELLRRLNLLFDECLSFDLYAEDFCMNAYCKYGVKSRVLPLKCRHYSRGAVLPRFFSQIEYLNVKYDKWEAFSVVGYFVGAGRTPLRRFQKAARRHLEQHARWVIRFMLYIAGRGNNVRKS